MQRINGDFQAVVLAAGMGTRMRSKTVKVLHEILGKPMLGYVLDTAIEAGAERVVAILGHQKERVESWMHTQPHADKLFVAHQKEQLGTAHAVLSAQEYFQNAPTFTLILSGDTPNMDAELLKEFIHTAVNSQMPLSLMTTELDDPGAYGRILRNDDNEVVGIVEYKDASPLQREIREVNGGIYFARTDFLARFLPELCAQPANNAQNEYYLTDLVAIAAQRNGVLGWQVDEPNFLAGINTRVELAEATAFACKRIVKHWLLEGVTMIDPSRVTIEPDVQIGMDSVLYPDVSLRGTTVIASGAVIENGCVIKDSHLSEDVHIKAYSYIDNAKIDTNSTIGPFAHLRPGADIGEGCKVGNFVEIKKTRLNDGAKASHLSYLGDAHIGQNANIGAGTITCNYDGKRKHQTIIGPNAFIGSNTALVAPVEVGSNAYVGAGSVITNNIPEDALGVARSRQKNIEGWGRRKKE